MDSRNRAHDPPWHRSGKGSAAIPLSPDPHHLFPSGPIDKPDSIRPSLDERKADFAVFKGGRAITHGAFEHGGMKRIAALWLGIVKQIPIPIGTHFKQAATADLFHGNLSAIPYSAPPSATSTPVIRALYYHCHRGIESQDSEALRVGSPKRQSNRPKERAHFLSILIQVEP